MGGSSVIAVRGGPGIGKTSLLVEYLHCHKGKYRQVWWCQAEDEDKLHGSLIEFGRHLGLVDDKETPRKEAAGHVLRLVEKMKSDILLIYDNADTLQSIWDMLPRSGAHILVSSRFPEPEGVSPINLNVLTKKDSIEFLNTYADRSDDAGAATLAVVLDGLPVVLDQAAAFCKANEVSFETYAAMAEELIRRAPKGRSYHLKCIYAAVEIAINNIAERKVDPCVVVRELFDFIGFCAPDRMPSELIDEAVPNNHAMSIAARNELVEVSLIKSDPFPDGSPGWVAHRVVQMVARNLAVARGTDRAAVDVLADSLLKFGWPNSKVDDPGRLRHAKVALHAWKWFGYAEGNNVSRAVDATLAYYVGAYLLDDARLDDARRAIKYALTIKTTMRHEIDSTVVILMFSLSAVETVAGCHAYALMLAYAALLVSQRINDTDHKVATDVYTRLGVSLTHCGDFDGGISAIRRAISHRTMHDPKISQLLEWALNIRYNGRLSSMNAGEAASLGFRIGHTRRNELPLRQQLREFEKINSEDHPLIVKTLIGLSGNLLNDPAGLDEHRVEAKQYLDRAESVLNKFYGENSSELASVHFLRGKLNIFARDICSAQANFSRCYTILQPSFGVNHPAKQRIEKVMELIAANSDFAQILEALYEPCPEQPVDEIWSQTMGTIFEATRYVERLIGIEQPIGPEIINSGFVISEEEIGPSTTMVT